jgi:hypothetical protein
MLIRIARMQRLPELNPNLSTHHADTLPIFVPPMTGSPPNFSLNSAPFPFPPEHTSSSLSSHLQVWTFMRFIPLASEISTGAILPKNKDVMNEEISEMWAVRSYTSGVRDATWCRVRRHACDPEMPISYLEDLRSGEALVGPTARQIRQLLRPSDCLLEDATLFASAKVLPDRCIGDGERARRELSYWLAWF